MYVRASFPTPPYRDRLAWSFQSTQGAQTGARELSHHGRGVETMAVPRAPATTVWLLSLEALLL